MEKDKLNSILESLERIENKLLEIVRKCDAATAHSEFVEKVSETVRSPLDLYYVLFFTDSRKTSTPTACFQTDNRCRKKKSSLFMQMTIPIVSTRIFAHGTFCGRCVAPFRTAAPAKDARSPIPAQIVEKKFSVRRDRAVPVL